MAESTFIWRFTPGRTEPRVLEAIFVQRETLLGDVLDRVRESATTGNKHHVLLVGPRGIGKTHFLALLRHRLAGDAALSARLRVAWLNEDETTTSFLDLLVRVYRALSVEYPQEFLDDVLQAAFDRPRRDVPRFLQQRLLESLRDHTLLVLVENLDAVFAGLGDAGQKQWRAFLQEHPVTCVVATAQQLFHGVSRRQNPFFGFFDTEHLVPLSVGEAVTLLVKIAGWSGNGPLVDYLQSPEGRSRVRALHHLAGGNHRAYVVLAELIDRDSLAELVGPFEKMVDELTPYYQERLRWLAPQQRRIVELLCTQTAPLPVKEIARRLFATEQTIASQLKKLRELGYVVSHMRGRESLYELTEPLMRLSFEVKENHREPLRLCVDFLRVWYRPEQLRDKLAMLPSVVDGAVAYLQAALQHAVADDLRLAAIQRDAHEAKQQGRLDEAASALEELAQTRGSADDWGELAACLTELARYDEAVEAADRAVAINPQDAVAWWRHGNALAFLDRHTEALASYEQAVAIDPHHAKAWYGRGRVLFGLGRIEEALASYERSLALDPGIALTWNNRAIALASLGRTEDALASLDKALEIDPQLTKAWGARGLTLTALGRLEEALGCFDRVLAIDPTAAHAWNDRGISLALFHRFDEALASHDKALAIAARPESWIGRGLVLVQMGRHEEAVAAFDAALEIDSENPSIWQMRAAALCALGRYEEALAGYERCLAIDPSSAAAWGGRGSVLTSLGRYPEAIASYDRSLAVFPKDAFAWFGRVGALFELGHLEEAVTSCEQGLEACPSSPALWSMRGTLLQLLQRHEEALESFDRGLAANAEAARAGVQRRDLLTLCGLARDDSARHLERLRSTLASEFADASIACSRAFSLFSLDRWEEGFQALQAALAARWLSGSSFADGVPAILETIRQRVADGARRRQLLTELVRVCADGGGLTHLGEGLVRSLAVWKESSCDREALPAWHQLWIEVGHGHLELEVPLRIFGVGVRYLMSDDPRALLDLLASERSLLRQALGLDEPHIRAWPRCRAASTARLPPNPAPVARKAFAEPS